MRAAAAQIMDMIMRAAAAHIMDLATVDGAQSIGVRLGIGMSQHAQRPVGLADIFDFYRIACETS